jgi:LuxR family maltose regulon positive regulatory protein
MTGLVARQHGDDVPQRSREVSAARGLLDRKDLLQLLDRAVTKRVTVISAPPGSGKTSLLRAWSDRPGQDRRIAFVSVAARSARCPAILARGAGRDPPIGRHR